MSERSEVWDADVERLDIARDLSAIEDAYLRLRVEAYHHADDPEIVGGDPMVMLGPRADIEAWGYVQLSALVGRLNPGVKGTSSHMRAIELEAIVTLDIEPPLSFLAGWVDIIRAERGQNRSNKRATIGGECDYLRDAIDWMLSTDENGDPWWLPIEDFGRQLRQVRWALERTVGLHEQRDTGAPCVAHGGAYLKRWGDAEDGTDDDWWCEKGKHKATEDEYRFAVDMMHRARADRLTATDLEAEYQIWQSTTRTWAQHGCLPKRGKDNSGRMLYDVAAAKALRDGEHEHDGCGRDAPKPDLLRDLLGA